ncbi:MAG: S-adenosylmethionine:tRNA ribosyltransferase-isomerase [Bacteroidetes bacterium]|nr:S-adenosylmethionine:tRNA ribosyltransferase-isomerase [Bacteroidota bacterium]MBL6963130.1 S-adenosylmethionine:tRNA ribosyltransferase-isomerase [Bacteroidota bacterium]
MPLDFNAYTYELPRERIAKFPLKKRDESRLLVYSSGQTKHTLFKDIENELPDTCMLVFNETKVIQARMIFTKNTGAQIEVFCLEPDNLNDEISYQLKNKKQAVWNCFVGNRRKWKSNKVLRQEMDIGGIAVQLSAEQIRSEGKNVIIRFNWNSKNDFSEILEHFGQTPIPPYLDREAILEDAQNYQTVYARLKGAVAAPTAGLHFTPSVLERLSGKGMKQEFITLHVSAGTFQPIETRYIQDHPMQNEQMVFSKRNIQNLLNHRNKIICVGTTSLRALESLYWFGAGLILHQLEKFDIEKLFPYTFKEEDLPSKEEALSAVLDYMKIAKLTQLVGETRIFIYPSYNFRICEGLITNYHLPKSTLILLVAAFIGEEWKKIYREAINNDYRFLSYGDSSLLLP